MTLQYGLVGSHTSHVWKGFPYPSTLRTRNLGRIRTEYGRLLSYVISRISTLRFVRLGSQQTPISPTTWKQEKFANVIIFTHILNWKSQIKPNLHTDCKTCGFCNHISIPSSFSLVIFVIHIFFFLLMFSLLRILEIISNVLILHKMQSYIFTNGINFNCGYYDFTSQCASIFEIGGNSFRKNKYRKKKLNRH